MSLFIVVALEDREERERSGAESGERRAESSNSPPESMPKLHNNAGEDIRKPPQLL